MPEAKKATPKPAAKAKPKVVKAKPAKANEAKKAVPASKPATKTVKPKATVKVAKERKTRGPNKPKSATSGSLAELQSLQVQFEKSKVKARKELKKEYQVASKEASKIATKYEELFGEPISNDLKVKKTKATGVKKGRPSGVKKVKTAKKVAGVKPFTLKEIEGFIEAKQEGIPVKLSGRRSKSIEKLETVFKQTQDPKEMLGMLK